MQVNNLGVCTSKRYFGSAHKTWLGRGNGKNTTYTIGDGKQVCLQQACNSKFQESNQSGKIWQISPPSEITKPAVQCLRSSFIHFARATNMATGVGVWETCDFISKCGTVSWHGVPRLSVKVSKCYGFELLPPGENFGLVLFLSKLWQLSFYRLNQAHSQHSKWK